MLAGRIVKEQSDTARFNVDLTAASTLFPSYLNGEGGTAPWLGTETAAAISTPTVVLGSGSWSIFPPPTTAPADPSPVTVQSAAIVAGTALQLFIVSGTPGNSYTITTVVTDTAGRKLTVEVGVQIAGQVTLAPAPVPNATLALPIGGGTLLGPLYLFEDPLTGKEASTKAYVDKQFQNGLFTSGLTVTGGTQVTGNSKVTGTLETTGALTVDAGGAQVTGNSKITGTLETTGALTVDAGGVTVTAGGATVTGNSKVTGTLETTGALTVDAGGAQVTGNSKITGTLEVTGALTADAGINLGAPGNITANTRVLFRGLINGLITSRNAGTPNTKIDISIGAALDEISQAGFIVSSGVLTIDAGTTGANGLDTGALAINTWYHIHVIGKTDGTAAGFLSTSLTPTLATGYTLRRRIGSVKTDGSSHFLAYSQNGDEFLWAASVLDVSVGAIPATTAVLAALSVPLGVKVNALFRATYGDSGPSSGIIFTSPDETDQPAQGGGASGLSMSSPQASASFGSVSNFNIRTDTSSRIRYRANATTGNAININTYGWIDTRARLV